VQTSRALHVAAYANPRRPVNLARHCFLDHDSAGQFYPDWNNAADAIVAILRAEAGRDPYEKDLQDLIGELSPLSEQFRAKWGTHDVRRHATGEKHFNHPVVGRLDPHFESADLAADPGWKLLIYTAEPASPTADALALLASWAATREAPANPAPCTPTTPKAEPPERTSPASEHRAHLRRMRVRSAGEQTNSLAASARTRSSGC
jgi:hypothetical protein